MIKKYKIQVIKYIVKQDDLRFEFGDQYMTSRSNACCIYKGFVESSHTYTLKIIIQ